MSAKDSSADEDWHGSIRIRVGVGERQNKLVQRLRSAGATSVHAGRFGIDAEANHSVVRDALGLNVLLSNGEVILASGSGAAESIVEPHEAYVPIKPDNF